MYKDNMYIKAECMNCGCKLYYVWNGDSKEIYNHDMHMISKCPTCHYELHDEDIMSEDAILADGDILSEGD